MHAPQQIRQSFPQRFYLFGLVGRRHRDAQPGRSARHGRVAYGGSQKTLFQQLLRCRKGRPVLTDQGNRLAGKAVITAVTTESRSKFSFDLAQNLQVSKVSVNGARGTKYAHLNNKLILTPSTKIPAGGALSVTIAYSGVRVSPIPRKNEDRTRAVIRPGTPTTRACTYAIACGRRAASGRSTSSSSSKPNAKAPIASVAIGTFVYQPCHAQRPHRSCAAEPCACATNVCTPVAAPLKADIAVQYQIPP